MVRLTPEQALHEYGEHARLVIYLAAAPGAGKTRRLLTDARRLRDSGKRVAIGWIETKGRPDLERLTESLPRIPTKSVTAENVTFQEFDLDAALAMRPDVVLLDELAHENLGDARNSKRWQDALALVEAGIGVLGALNVAHLESVAATAEGLLGYPVREIVPLSFVRRADEVIAIDASPQLLRERLFSGKIVAAADIERASEGPFRESTLIAMRELLLRTIDDLTIPSTAPASVSTAVVLVPHDVEPSHFLARSAPIAGALDLALEILPDAHLDARAIERLAAFHVADVLPPDEVETIDIDSLRASMLCVPLGAIARRIVNVPVLRDIFVVDADQSYLEESGITTPLSGTIGDRMRVGYGKLTVYLGAAAGAGKTYAMLDRGQQLAAEDTDVVIGLVETHGREETAAMIGDLETVPRRSIEKGGMIYYELDRDAILARKPRVVLVDELAHTNAPGSLAAKRYLDVLAFLRAGIDVLTTLNVQHLEALSDVVYRLTGTVVRETLPDSILPLADEVILIDVSPETLRDRLRAGKIYPPQRIEAALANFFRTENLASLRELAIRETLRSKTRQRFSAPFSRLLLSVVSREDDMQLVRKAGRLAARMEVDFAIAHVAERRDRVDETWREEFERVARTINADFIDVRGVPDAAAELLALSRSAPETVIAVGGTHRRPRWPAKPAFARRLLDAGARELLVLTRAHAAGSDERFDDD